MEAHRCKGLLKVRRPVSSKPPLTCASAPGSEPGRLGELPFHRSDELKGEAINYSAPSFVRRTIVTVLWRRSGFDADRHPLVNLEALPMVVGEKFLESAVRIDPPREFGCAKSIGRKRRDTAVRVRSSPHVIFFVRDPPAVSSLDRHQIDSSASVFGMTSSTSEDVSGSKNISHPNTRVSRLRTWRGSLSARLGRGYPLLAPT